MDTLEVPVALPTGSYPKGKGINLHLGVDRLGEYHREGIGIQQTDFEFDSVYPPYFDRR